MHRAVGIVNSHRRGVHSAVRIRAVRETVTVIVEAHAIRGELLLGPVTGVERHSAITRVERRIYVFTDRGESSRIVIQVAATTKVCDCIGVVLAQTSSKIVHSTWTCV